MACLQEKNKVQVQAVGGQENLFASRPSTSNRRPSSRNGSLGNATTVNKRLSVGIPHLGSNSIKSPDRALSLKKESNKSQGQMLPRRGRASYIIEDTASVVSATYPGTFSP